MRAEVIFQPMGVLALWTGVIFLMTGTRRILAVQRGQVPVEAFKLGERHDVPADVSVPNRNLMNLLEMPMLFYVVTLAFYVTRHVTAGVVTLAWVYVALRLAHSLIHITSNRVLQRLMAFAASNFVLVALWISFLVHTGQ